MSETRDYSSTLSLPKTDFPMRAGLPKKEPEIIARWEEMDLYKKLREDAKGREKYVLHDGPPYANGNLHIGHALNKILKDVITRSFQMRGFDSNYVPGWDCHGLPIEWKIEEQYRAKGKNKDEVPINEFRQECRDFASHWVGVQTEEFLRLGVTGDFKTPYLTMNYDSEAFIAKELMKFAQSGQLYRGSKPIMWSVVERTALAEAEIEYEIMESDTVWVKFPIEGSKELEGASVVIWTTTPWTIPANRAVCYSTRIPYGLYEVTSAENDFGPQAGDKLIFADKLAEECGSKAKVEMKKLRDVKPSELAGITLAHPLADANLGGYEFTVPLLAGDHVTDEAGTGFVHTAPSHGRDDFEAWMSATKTIEAMGIDTRIPFPVDDAGYYTEDAPGFGPDTGNPARVIDDKGKKGDANQRVITALIGVNNLFARGRVKHEYPHSWRSKKPIIFRNTPQWFVHMDKDGVVGDTSQSNMGTLRQTALAAIDETRFVPAAGQNRLRDMIEKRPDWVLSRQRAWGVPIAVFRNAETGQIIPGPEFDRSEELMARITDAFKEEGADAWYNDGAKERFLEGMVDNAKEWDQISDILDVWFDSGSTHAFCLEQREDLKWPADLYLEGSDQHRGWFHSSLLESCGTRGRAPYDAVLTHGFVMAEDGRKMSKSLGNQVTPQQVIQQSGADILRIWVAQADYAEDLRIGPEIIKTAVDAYRKLRNTFKHLLGMVGYYDGTPVSREDMPDLERYMLHRLAELDSTVREGYDAFDFKKVFSNLLNFMNIELSAFYFDIRKDAQYCDGPSSKRRKASLYVMSELFDCLTAWMAPILCFTTEEAWLQRHPDAKSVHLRQFPDIPADWYDETLTERWTKIRTARRVVTTALEDERREKRIGSSLEAAPIIYLAQEYQSAFDGMDADELLITSGAELRFTDSDKAIDHPDLGENSSAFVYDQVGPSVAVVNRMAQGKKCARSWRVLPEVGTDKDYPDLSLRDAAVMRELEG